MQIHESTTLFEAVQMNNIFSDGKTFPDCLPKYAMQDIEKAYFQERNSPNFDLKQFVDLNFDLPKTYSTDIADDISTEKMRENKTAEQHINQLWAVLTRQPDNEKSSLISLPFPYIVPGGRFREIYYWDSYFTMLGLQISKRVDMIQNMVDNFAYLLNQVGHIPNGNRAYYVGRSQPPFFALMVRLLSEEKGSEILIKYLPELEKEHLFWMNGVENLSENNNAMLRVVRLPDGSILNRYWDENNTPRPESYKEDVEIAHQSAQKPEDTYRHLRAAAESGWDFSSRWLATPQSLASIHTTDFIPVDLNCLLANLEKTLAEAHTLNGNIEKADFYQNLLEKRQNAIEKYCWNEHKGFYFDYDFIKKSPTDSYTLAAVFPLFFKMATDFQANKVAETLQSQFLKAGGLTTTTVFSGQQWDAPNGWAPLQWMAFKGLMNYGLKNLANEIKTHWLSANLGVYEKTGKMTEKYDVYNEDLEAGGGEYPNQDGFGWTNGVFLALTHSE